MGATDQVGRLRQLSRLPLWVAPMGGGPSTPAMVAAAARAGAFAFLAAAYRSAAAMTEQMDAVRTAGVSAFGVNVFVPGTPAQDPALASEYVASLAPDAGRLGVAPAEPAWDDDGWDAKIAALLASPPAAVSFTFGCPPADVLAAFTERGSLTLVTVTSADEARLAEAAGADALCVQGPEAGGHRSMFADGAQPAAGQPNGGDIGGGGARGGEPGGGYIGGGIGGGEPGLRELLAEIGAATRLPLVAAGGLAGPADVVDVLSRGVVAAQLGTVFLRCPESGAHPVYKGALADPRFTETAVTRSFSGRPARGLVNQFMRDHPVAPAAYPEINNATRPLRAAAAAAGDPDRMSLWAGLGFRAASDRPAGEVVAMLAEGLK